MTRKLLILFLALSSIIYGDESIESAQPDQVTENIKSPEQIEQEIQTAQHDFDIAKKMFIPWYTGPLITGAANNVPPGSLLLQSYLYFTINHAQYNNHRRSVNTPNTYILNPLVVIETGITKWLDITTVPQAFFRWKKGHFASNFADLPLQLGFQIYRETPYIPSIRLLVGEIFPTGKYQHLNPHKLGIDATGAGVFATTVGLNLSKVFWWFKLHPFATRLATSYVVPDDHASVDGFNAYGGGFHTDGTVKVGNTFNTDLGLELSLTQKWVLAMDIAYTYSNKSTFSGKPGETATGTAAANGAPSSDQLSLSPAIEYNYSDVAGFIGGVWFSVYGRNSPNFASIVLSYYIVF
jgi:hypothetical protein